MLNSSSPSGFSPASEDDAIDAIVASGPRGALAIAGITTAIVIALWLAFYLFVFSPRVGA